MPSADPESCLLTRERQLYLRPRFFRGLAVRTLVPFVAADFTAMVFGLLVFSSASRLFSTSFSRVFLVVSACFDIATLSFFALASFLALVFFSSLALFFFSAASCFSSLALVARSFSLFFSMFL